MNTDSAEYRAQIARLDSLKDFGHLLDGATRVQGSVATDLRHIFSLRIGADELAEISGAAAASKKSISEFIRDAALREARHQTSMDLPLPVLEAVEQLVRRYQVAKTSTKRRRATSPRR